MVAKKQIFVRENSHVTKIWKTTFPKEFFNKFWLKVGEHKYIYIAEIKFEKKYYSIEKCWPKIFCHTPNVHLC